MKSRDRGAIFHPHFRQDLQYWFTNDRKIAVRVLDLVEEIMRDPFNGIGKPEPLRGDLQGTWSRRITGEHRLLYHVSDAYIAFVQARHH